MATTWKDTTKRITVYPAPGQTGVPSSFNRCQEHPTPFGGTCDPARRSSRVAEWFLPTLLGSQVGAFAVRL